MTSNVEFLDLDEAVPQMDRKVRIKGKDYLFKEPDVADFAAETSRLTKMQMEVKKISDMDEEEREIALNTVMMDMTLSGIKRAFPDMPDDVLNGLTVRQITAIREFIQTEITEASEEAEDDQGNVSAA